MTVPPRRRDARAERNARLAARYSGNPAVGNMTSADEADRYEMPPEASEMGQIPVIRVKDQGPWCLVVPDALGGRFSAHDHDVLGAARQLADQLGGGVIALAPSGGEEYALRGIDRLVDTTGLDGPAQRLTLLAHLVMTLEIRHSLFPDTTTGGGHLARALSARCQLSITTAITRFSMDKLTRWADDGRREQCVAPSAVMALLPESADPLVTSAHEARILEVSRPSVTDVHETSSIKEVAVQPANVMTTPLDEANFIVSGGIGVTAWPELYQLTERMRGVIGATRAICDAGVLPRDRQIGVSGTLVAPQCYLALGISGASQHLQGITDCQRVVAINTDLHAAMVRRADLAIIADAQAVIGALLDLLKEPGNA